MRRHNFVLPQNITFSGADDRTDIDEMIKLARLYNLEYAILLSPERRGVPRYPSLGWILELKRRLKIEMESLDNHNAEDHDGISPYGTWHRARLAVHLCGDYAEMMAEEGYFGEENLLEDIEYIQINLGRQPTIDEAGRINKWRTHYEKQIILQVPDVPRAYIGGTSGLLMDTSRGTGVTPDCWPSTDEYVYNTGSMITFAGGLGPHNLIDECVKITRANPRTNYNVDMESKIRNEFDEFDLTKVKECLIQLWGDRIFDHDGTVIDTDQIATRREEEAARERRRIRDEQRMREEEVMEQEEAARRLRMAEQRRVRMAERMHAEELARQAAAEEEMRLQATAGRTNLGDILRGVNQRFAGLPDTEITRAQVQAALQEELRQAREIAQDRNIERAQEVRVGMAQRPFPHRGREVDDSEFVDEYGIPVYDDNDD